MVEFDLLAAGPGTGPGVRMLSAGVVARRRKLIQAVLEHLSERPALRSAAEMLRPAVAVLEQAERVRPEAVAGRDGLLLHPFVGVWADDLLLRLQAPRAESTRAEVDREIEARIGYLVAGVAAVAVSAGSSVTLDVVLSADGLPVPGAGRFVVPERSGPARACLRTGSGRLDLYPSDGRRARWEPNRRLPQGISGRLMLDDTDPYRAAFGSPVERQSAEQATGWTETMAGAWRLIQADYADYRPGLDAGLRVITPLSASSAGPSVRSAYGAIGVVLPPTPARLVLLMLFEFQQMKLAALTDLMPLLDPDDDTRYQAPGRPEPGPISAWLRETYGRLAVTDFWRRYRNRTDDPAAAQQQFARCLAESRDSIDALLRASALNDLGRRLVTGMATTIGAWTDETDPMVDLSAIEAAADAVVDDRS